MKKWGWKHCFQFLMGKILQLTYIYLKTVDNDQK